MQDQDKETGKCRALGSHMPHLAGRQPSPTHVYLGRIVIPSPADVKFRYIIDKPE